VQLAGASWTVPDPGRGSPPMTGRLKGEEVEEGVRETEADCEDCEDCERDNDDEVIVEFVVDSESRMMEWVAMTYSSSTWLTTPAKNLDLVWTQTYRSGATINR